MTSLRMSGQSGLRRKFSVDDAFRDDYEPAIADRDLVRASFSACFSTAFSSFSMEEKRRRISCMRIAMLRMVSICERSPAESEPGSSTSKFGVTQD